MLSEVEMEKRFGRYKHRPKDAPSIAPVHRDFRTMFKQFADEVEAWLPDGRYKELAMTDLESSLLWAHKAIEIDL